MLLLIKNDFLLDLIIKFIICIFKNSLYIYIYIYIFGIIHVIMIFHYVR